jgi:hypothetical protein
MSIFRQISAMRFILGAAVLIIGGAAIVGFLIAYFFYAPGAHMSGLPFTEHMIVCISVGTAVFVCASGGYFSLRAVSRSRLHALMAAMLFFVLAIISAFIPQLLMVISQAWWPHAFHGDAGWNFVLAPVVTSFFLLGLSIIFIIGLVLCRHSSAKSGTEQ